MPDKIKETKKKTIITIAIIVLCGSMFVFRSAQSDTKALGTDNQVTDPCQPVKSSESNPDYMLAKDSNDHKSSGYDNIGGELYSKALLAVLFVVVLGIAAIYVSKKLLPKLTNVPGKEIHIVETVHLGPRKAVHLLEIGGRRYLIGSTNEKINTLADLNSISMNQSALETDINFEKIDAQQSY
jgi:flagellar biosynthetic protein FliO